MDDNHLAVYDPPMSERDALLGVYPPPDWLMNEPDEDEEDDAAEAEAESKP